MAMARIVEAVASGDMTPAEGRAVSGLIEGLRKALEAAVQEQIGDTLMKAMAKRLKRLKVRVGQHQLDDLTDEALLAKAASLLCGISLSQFCDLQAEQTDPRQHHALSDQQQFTLAIVSADNEAIGALLIVYSDGTWREAEAMDEVFGKAYEEWQRLRAARSAEGFTIGREASWMFMDRKFGISPP